MTSSGSGLADRLGQLRAEARAGTAAIVERVRQSSEEATRRVREQDKVTEQRLKELAERREQAKIKKEQDPNANNQWLQRREAQDGTFQFGPAEEAEQQKPVQAPAPRPFTAPQPEFPAPPSPAVPAPPPQAKPRGVRPTRRDDESDDDYFSNTSWLNE